jgi:hypothetical protein
LLGLCLVVVGVILLVLAYDVQMEIHSIGTTNDPVLQDRLDLLEDRKNTFIVASIGTLFLGVFGFAVLVEPTMPATISNAQMVSAARTARDFLSGLSLAGNAIYLPAKHGLTSERMMIPASVDGDIPPFALTDDMRLSPGKDGSAPGMLMEPQGSGLLARIESERGGPIKDAGLESVEGNLQMLKHGLDMMRDFHLKEREDRLVLRVEYDGLREACRDIRKEMPSTCRQVQCIGCSCILVAIARATGKMVRVEDVDNSGDRVVFMLSLSDW